MDIKEKIKRIVDQYKTNNPFEIAKYKNIDIRYENLGKALGFTDTLLRHTTIHINQNTPEYLQRFICAHELGHIYLHKSLNIPFFTRVTFFSQNKFERQANKFAVELLLPDQLVESGQSLTELAQICYIPEELVFLKKYK